jgi:hypothetical protein
MSFLVDSDVLIEVSRAKNESTLSMWPDLSASNALILFSPLNQAELWAGARPTEFDRLAELFGALVFCRCLARRRHLTARRRGRSPDGTAVG